MTALCGGGPSGPIPGFNQTVVVTSAAVEGAMILLGLEPLAAVLGPVIAGTTYDLTTFCATDPPADPGLTGADILAVTDWGDPFVSLPAIQKVYQWFKSWYWYQVCKCTSVATPAAPTPSNPGNVISTNPGLPAGPNTDCYNGQVSKSQVQTTSNVYSDITGLLLPTNGPSIQSSHLNVQPTGGITDSVWPIPPTATQVVFTFSPLAYGASGGASNELVAGLNFLDSSGNHLSGTELGQADASELPNIVTTITRGGPNWPSVATYWNVEIGISGSSTPQALTQKVSIVSVVTCGGQALQQPCCPPDPTIEQRLSAIWGILQSIYASLPTATNSFSQGTAHTGLSGSGNFAISPSAIAVRIDLTTIPNDVGIVTGDPLTYFNAGYVTSAAVEGNYKSHRIMHTPEVFLLDTLADAIHYTLNAGVVATITELTKGP